MNKVAAQTCWHLKKGLQISDPPCCLEITQNHHYTTPLHFEKIDSKTNVKHGTLRHESMLKHRRSRPLKHKVSPAESTAPWYPHPWHRWLQGSERHWRSERRYLTGGTEGQPGSCGGVEPSRLKEPTTTKVTSWWFEPTPNYIKIWSSKSNLGSFHQGSGWKWRILETTTSEEISALDSLMQKSTHPLSQITWNFQKQALSKWQSTSLWEKFRKKTQSPKIMLLLASKETAKFR